MNDTLATLRAGITSPDVSSTHAWAKRLAREIPENTVLALHGPVGAGKSTFVQGLARAWGIEQPTTSPTFNLFHVYRGTRTLVHMDAYRLKGPEQMDELMVEDFLSPPYCLAIEWAEHIEAWLPPEHWSLELSILAPGQHHLRLR